MRTTTFNRQFERFKLIFFKLFILGSSLILFGSNASCQIVLHDHPISFKPKEFHIADVIDERSQQAAAAQSINFQGSTAIDIRRYIDHNLSKDQSLRPVVISIKEVKLTETVQTDGHINGNINLYLSFGLQKNYGIDHLIDYKGKLQFRRSNTDTLVLENSIRNLLQSSLSYFNNWIDINANTNRKLATKVKISFTDYTTATEGDTIYYAASRPLTWADFQSRIKPITKYQALVMPGIAYEQQAEISKGTIMVQIAMKAFLPKSACWANYTGRDQYTLNHEQRHFDLVKISSEDFKQKLLDQKLTPDNFEALINMQYLDTLRDLHAAQTSYDNETNHGTNTSAQAKWNTRIDRLLNYNR